MQLNSKLWCFDQFPASVSTCVVCQVEDTLAVFEKMPKDRGAGSEVPLQKPPSRGLEGSGGEGGGGRRSEGRRGLHLRKASRGLQGGFNGA